MKNRFTGKWMIRLFVGFLGSIVLCASPMKAGTPISTCGFVIAQSGEYDVAADIGPCGIGDGIDIAASNVTLRLNGHTISGGPPGSCSDSDGINVIGGLLVPLSRVRILGPGTISNFGNFTGTPSAGVVADSSAGSFVKFVTVTADCVGLNISGLWITSRASMWKLASNIVSLAGAGGSGIVVEGDDNELVRNSLNKPIRLFGSNNTVVRNSANGALDGIVVRVEIPLAASNNDIDTRTTDNNSSHGIWIQTGATGNSVSGNTSFNNGVLDLEDDNFSCDNNKWTDNHFNTTNNPSCVH